MTFIVALSMLLVIVAFVLMAVGYAKGNEEMLAAGGICIVIAAIVLLGMMCTGSFWRGFFGVGGDS